MYYCAWCIRACRLHRPHAIIACTRQPAQVGAEATGPSTMSTMWTTDQWTNA
ncbi:hypothetical protein BDI24065_04882 [Burkholderia diffusa]|uniref:Uncharacterized protein n=1 Tax=Burkholderia diffusa TaxID=488732 RepID=A0A6P2P0J9_9BURK|nr:hypothetical protein BDI24065_04882 [Burkholderia diffusa]